jgi:hypothetical protein
MAITVSLYNHTRSRFGSGANAVADTYKVILCTAATFDATNTTLAAITKTEVANANGYTTGGLALTGVAVSIVSTSNAKFDADDASWSASGGSIAAAKAILFNDTDTDDPPVALIDFDGTVTAADGTNFVIRWNSNGIFTFTAPA